VEHIDIATANGTPFVHQFGVGIHARLVRIRNDMVYHSRVGKMVASLRAIMAAALNPPQFRVQLETPKGVITRTVSGIAVSNNPLDNGAVPVAETLDAGVLGVYLADRVTTSELLGLAFDVFTGRWRENDLVSEAEVPELTLHFPHKKSSAHAVIDGELVKLDRDVELRIHRLGLKVIRPAAPKDTEGGTNFLE
jgi:diacylglycerol kinase family enzyme